MSQTNAIIDNESLIVPISEEQPCGVDIRVCSERQASYYDLKELCQRHREQEENLLIESTEDSTMPDWQPIIDQVCLLLKDQTKDIELCCWLTEALVRKQGFLGFIAGFKLLNRMIDTFQTDLHPLSVEEGSSTELMAISALSGANQPGTLISPLNLSTLLASGNEVISLWDIYLAEQSQQQNTSHSILAQAPQAELVACQGLLIECAEVVSQLEKTVGEYYESDSFSIARLRSLFIDAQQTIEAFIFHESDKDDELEAGSGTNILQTEKSSAVSGIQTALSYYENQEPHSPISFLLKRALHWQSLNLKEILAEMIMLEGSDLSVSNALCLSIFNDEATHS